MKQIFKTTNYSAESFFWAPSVVWVLTGSIPAQHTFMAPEKILNELPPASGRGWESLFNSFLLPRLYLLPTPSQLPPCNTESLFQECNVAEKSGGLEGIPVRVRMQIFKKRRQKGMHIKVSEAHNAGAGCRWRKTMLGEQAEVLPALTWWGAAHHLMKTEQVPVQVE